jgi:hypothetical protein
VIALPALVLFGFALSAITADLPVSGPLAVAFLLSAPVTALLVSRLKRRLDRAYRARVSTEAAGDDRAAGTAMFLADGEPPADLADDRHGVLVVTGRAWLEYVWNGRSALVPATQDPNSWLPWPALAVDGTPRPFSWRSWAYRLPPGEHEVTVAVRSPAGEAGPPVPALVRVTAGGVTRLDLRVKARTEVRSVRPGARVPTELTGFSATVDPELR